MPKESERKTYILKLFDRRVDLATFVTTEVKSNNKPLYPVCRAWVHGPDTPRSDESTTNHPEIDNENFNLPPPKSKLAAIQHFNMDPNDGDIDLRIPQSVRDFKPQENIEKSIDDSISNPLDHDECLENNKQRWKKVRNEWAEVRKVHEYRYEESFKILDDMFNDRLQRGS